MYVREVIGLRRFTARPNLDINIRITFKEGATLAKPNYQFQKRQRELEKKKKKEEKRQRKQAKSDGESQEQDDTIKKDS